MARVVDEADTKETPEERFCRLATRRTNHILHHVRVLGNLANRATYRFTDEQIVRIFAVIDAAVAEVKALFRPRKKPDFRL